MKIVRSGIAVALLATAACATSRSHVAGADAGPITQIDAQDQTIRFAGQFSPVLKIMSGSAMVSGSNRLRGTVTVISDPGSDDRFTVEMDFTSERGPETLWWSIVEGSCGTAGIPLVPPRQLREIYVPSSGNVRTSGLFRSTLVRTTAYHLNLYVEGSSTLTGVIACADLKKG